MTKPFFSICILFGIVVLVLISQLFQAWAENGRWNVAYTSILHEEDNLRENVRQLQQRETASNEKVADLQRELTRCNKALDIAEARLLQIGQDKTSDASGASPEPQSKAQNYTITDRSGRVYNVSIQDYQRLFPISQSLDKQGHELDRRLAEVNGTFDNLDRKKNTVDLTNSYAVDQYNAELAQAKGNQNRYNDDINIFNSKVNDFNTELERVGSLIK